MARKPPKPIMVNAYQNDVVFDIITSTSNAENDKNKRPSFIVSMLQNNFTDQNNHDKFNKWGITTALRTGFQSSDHKQSLRTSNHNTFKKV